MADIRGVGGSSFRKPPYIAITKGKVEDILVTDPSKPDTKRLVDFIEDDILNAKDTIHVDMYSVVPSAELLKFANALRKAFENNPNLKVRIVENLLPEQERNKRIFEKFKVNPFLKAFRTSKVKALFKSDHSKFITIDQRIATIGDQNIQDQPEVGKGYNWFGVTLKLSGEVVRFLDNIFRDSWNSSIGVNVPSSDKLPPIPVKYQEVGKADDVFERNLARSPDEVIVAYSEPWNNKWYKRIFSKSYRDDLRDLMISAVDHAKHEVKIISPNLGSLRMVRALARALKRGVKVKILLSKNFNVDENLFPSLDNAGDNIRALAILKLLAGKGALKNLTVKWYSNDGKIPEEGNKSLTSHGKYISVDGKFASYGSFNQDALSYRTSKEVNVAFNNPQVVRRLERTFWDEVWNRGIEVNLNALPPLISYTIRSIYLALRTLMKRVK